MPGVRKTIETKSKETKKATPKVESKIEAKKPVTKKTGRLSVPIFSLTGRESGKLELPEGLFGDRINKNLLAQAMRVYMTNLKEFTASTKTRGEVRGSTAKIFRQKGTGRARHGGIRAPIFVGGGIVFGPKPRKVVLDLPKKMKRSALLSALSSKLKDQEVVGLNGFEKMQGKTKEITGLINKLKDNKKTSALIITGEKNDNIVRAVRNVPGVDALPSNMLNAYEVLRHRMLIVTKEGLNLLESRILKKTAGKGTK